MPRSAPDPGEARDLIVVLGAAVWEGGRPSPALARRIAYALDEARRRPDVQVFCSGGLGRHPPSEARVMAEHLAAAGVARARLILDEASRDTLQNVTAAAAHMRAQGLARAIVCTDAYHAPRVRMIFRLLGLQAQAADLPRRRADVRLAERRRMWLRELAAYPYDALVTLWRRRDLLRRVESGRAA